MRKIVLAVFLWISAISAGFAEQAQDLAKAFDDALLAAMKAGKDAGIQGRSAVIAPAVDKDFDLTEMTRLVLGSAGKALTPEDIARIAAAFRAYTVANYARNFDGFSGERFETDASRPAGAAAVVVPSRLIPADGSTPVELDFVMKGGPDHWRIVDVLAEGAVSQMAAKRVEFVPILRKDGVDGLVASLDAKTKILISDH